MKWLKFLYAGVLITMVTGAFLYCYNIDMYRAVGTMSPVNGYPALVECLRDKEWVLENYESWATAHSPILQSLYMYLTGQSATFPTYMVNANRVFMILWSYTSTLTWPFMFYMSIRNAKIKRKELGL